MPSDGSVAADMATARVTTQSYTYAATFQGAFVKMLSVALKSGLGQSAAVCVGQSARKRA
eukprot:5210661-Prymnesium_polylepis.1